MERLKQAVTGSQTSASDRAAGHGRRRKCDAPSPTSRDESASVIPSRERLVTKEIPVQQASVSADSQFERPPQQAQRRSAPWENASTPWRPAPWETSDASESVVQAPLPPEAEREASTRTEGLGKTHAPPRNGVREALRGFGQRRLEQTAERFEQPRPAMGDWRRAGAFWTAALALASLPSEAGTQAAPEASLHGAFSSIGAEVRDVSAEGASLTYRGRVFKDPVNASPRSEYSGPQLAVHRALTSRIREYNALTKSAYFPHVQQVQPEVQRLEEDIERMLALAFPRETGAQCKEDGTGWRYEKTLDQEALQRLVSGFARLGVSFDDVDDLLLDQGLGPASTDLSFGRSVSLILEGDRDVWDLPRDANGKPMLSEEQRGAFELIQNLAPSERTRLQGLAGFEAPTEGPLALQAEKLGNRLGNEELLDRTVHLFSKYNLDLKDAKATGASEWMRSLDARIGAEATRLEEEARSAAEAQVDSAKADESKEKAEDVEAPAQSPLQRAEAAPVEAPAPAERVAPAEEVLGKAAMKREMVQGFLDAGRPDLARAVNTPAFDTWVQKESGWQNTVSAPTNQGRENIGPFQVWVVNLENWGIDVAEFKSSVRLQTATVAEKFPQLTPGRIEAYAWQIQYGQGEQAYQGWG